MSLLYHGECNEMMKQIPDESVDLIFCDLPYGQTSCKWDKMIDHEKMWEHFMRVKKLRTPIFFTTTTKFGVELISSAPKKCPFRYDIVWIKSAPCGFLSARKMPMRKHEMIYVFYEKLPMYDLSSHQHKFKKTKPRTHDDNIYGMVPHADGLEGVYTPPLPVSVMKLSNNPPLPTSVIKRDIYGKNHIEDDGKRGSWTPPLPVSVIKVEKEVPFFLTEKSASIYGDLTLINWKERKNGESRYTPPLPTSILKEGTTIIKQEINEGQIYNGGATMPYTRYTGSKELTEGNTQVYKPPLPTSIVKEDVYNYKERVANGKLQPTKPNQYAVPLPNSVQGNKDEVICPVCSEYPDSCLEIKSKKGKHSTQKPVELMKWVFKYYSKEGDVVLDPTMGSGSTGVACNIMKRNFIGIEKDEEIYKVALERVEVDADFISSNKK